MGSDNGLLHFIILGCATWRLASLLTREHGPVNVFDRIRHWVGVRYNEYSEMYGTNQVSEAVLCIWCNSVWIGIALAILYYLVGEPFVWVMLPLALSTVAICLDR